MDNERCMKARRAIEAYYNGKIVADELDWILKAIDAMYPLNNDQKTAPIPSLTFTLSIRFSSGKKFSWDFEDYRKMQSAMERAIDLRVPISVEAKSFCEDNLNPGKSYPTYFVINY